MTHDPRGKPSLALHGRAKAWMRANGAQASYISLTDEGGFAAGGGGFGEIMILVTAEQMRACDQRTINGIGLPGMVLMENAAQGAVRGPSGPGGLPGGGAGWRVLAGRGNNGGDGLAMARILANQGALCDVYLLAEKSQLTGDAAMNLKVALACGVRVVEAPDEARLEALSGGDRAPRAVHRRHAGHRPEQGGKRALPRGH